MRRIAAMTRNPLVVALFLTLAVAGCANKKTPNTAADLGLSGGAATPGSAKDFTVNVGDRIFFDTDSYTVDDEDRPILNAQAQWLQRNPNVRVTIEGHADERGTREYNLALGDRRANAAKNYLAGQGIAESRMTVISYGKERPAALGSDEEAWAKNRRSVTIIPE